MCARPLPKSAAAVTCLDKPQGSGEYWLMWGMFARALFLLVCLVSWAAPAKADFDSSREWFSSLTQEQRFALQTNLILLGFYSAFADGEFGRGTYGAITAFQKSRGFRDTGILSSDLLSVIAERAAKVYNEWGIDVVEDQQSGSTAMMPLALLTERSPATGGNAYVTADGGLIFQTFRIPASEGDYATLYRGASTESAGYTVGYKSYSDERFVVSGKDRGASFYTLVFNVGDASIGFSASWNSTWKTNGPVAVTFVASHFVPTSFLGEQPDPVPETTTVTPPAQPTVKSLPVAGASEEEANGEWVGAFFLPRDLPDAISFFGDIVSETPLQFLRALRARPNAKVLVLHSAGGLVDPGLVMAHEVRERRLDTVILDGGRCFSACAFIFLAGADRLLAGELGVHQIWNEGNDLESGQAKLSDVIEALDEFGVHRDVLSVMLRTSPNNMHVFSDEEVMRYGLNRGDPLGDTIVLSPQQESAYVTDDDGTVTIAGNAATKSEVFVTASTTTVATMLIQSRVAPASIAAVVEVFRLAHGISSIPKDTTVAIYTGPALYGDGNVPYRVDLFDLPSSFATGEGTASVILNSMGSYVMGTLNPAERPRLAE